VSASFVTQSIAASGGRVWAGLLRQLLTDRALWLPPSAYPDQRNACDQEFFEKCPSLSFKPLMRFLATWGMYAPRSSIFEFCGSMNVPSL
jgi:hypothetical protein